MRILIDTNIFVSTILGGGTPFRAYTKAVTSPHNGVICTQNLDELRRIFSRKFPNKVTAMERFLAVALPSLEIIKIPIETVEEEKFIRDKDDRTIMRAAVIANVDIILTGDKDFLDSGILHPKVMTATEFLSI